MDIKLKISEKSRLAYIPKRIHDILGNNPTATPNRAAILLYSENTTIDSALRSLDIIKRDLQHAKEEQDRKIAEQNPMGETAH